MNLETPRDVVIRQTEAIVSQASLDGSGRDFVRAINTENDSIHTMLTDSGNVFSLNEYVILARSADYKSIAMVSSANDFSYTQSGIAGRSLQDFGKISALGVSRDGALHAIATPDAVIVEDQQFETVQQLPIAGHDLSPCQREDGHAPDLESMERIEPVNHGAPPFTPIARSCALCLCWFTRHQRTAARSRDLG